MLAEQRAKFLQDQAIQQQQAQAQQQAAQFAQQMAAQSEGRALQTRQFEADEADRKGQRERQGKLDEVAAGQRRQDQNAVGVRRMIGDFLVQRGAQPLDAGSRQTLQGMALQEDVALPASVASDPDVPHKRAIELENLRHKNDLSQIAAQGAQSRQTAATKPAPAGRGVLSGDANRIAELRSSLDDLGTLRKTIAAPGESGATGTMAKVGAMVPNAVTEMTGFGMAAKQKQAVIDRVKQVIGKALEGGVLRKEDEAKYARILPTIADPDAVVETKLSGLNTAIRQRLDQQIEALEQAGYNVGGFKGIRVMEGSDKTVDPNDALLDELLGTGR
jgi:hypothetical protein